MVMAKRLVYLDIAKALCIILVVIGHYSPDGCPEWWMAVHDFIYSFHMPLFMFASGFVYIATKRDEEKYGNFIMKKVKRLMIPYFVVSAIVIAIKLLTEGHAYVENPKTIMSFVKMFYYPEAGYFLWFIWALWWMFVIVPVFKTKLQRLVLFAISILLHYVPFATTDIFCVSQFKNMLVFFMLGVIVYDWKDCLSAFERVPKIAYVGAFVIAYLLSVVPVFGGHLLSANCLLPFLGIAAIISLSKMIEQSKLKNDWLMITSASSYIIYLFHTTCEGFAKALVFKLPYLKDIDNGVLFMIGAVFVVACGVIIPIILNEKVFKRYSVTRILCGLK